MTTPVLAPMAGELLPLADAPDPVFAAQMMGSGLAIRPAAEPGVATAPISGTLVRVMPHAYVIAGADGGVLVHLGIDTVQLDGEGFHIHVTEGDDIAAGAEVISWNPGAVAAGGRCELVLVCALDTPANLVNPGQSSVEVNQELFELPLK